MSKNIIVCCDGTNNEIAGNQTNVLRLFRMLSPVSQLAFYDAGVGTKADPTAFWPLRRYLRKKLDMAVGMSIRPNVLEAYQFLARAYSPGDRLYLFGFSRGAYTVRALAGMIRRCGLLRPEHLHLKEYAWSLYSDEDRTGDGVRQFGGAARVKKVFSQVTGTTEDGKPSHDVPIHFLGVFDTVSAFGWLWDPQTLPDTRTNNNIRRIRHAVSIDERRTLFPPNHFVPAEGQDCQVVWFAGVHADIGGGYVDEESGLARITLRWMLKEAKLAGLEFNESEERRLLGNMGKQDDDALAVAHNEASRILWRLLSLFTLRSAKRGIPPRSQIHASVKRRMAEKSLAYRPNLPKDLTYIE